MSQKRKLKKVTTVARMMLGVIPKYIVEMIIFPPCDPAEVDGGALDCVLTVGHLVIPPTPSHLHIQNENGMRIPLTQADRAPRIKRAQ